MTNQMTIPGFFTASKPTPIYLWGMLDKAAHKFVARATVIANGKKTAITKVFQDRKHEAMLDACAEVRAATEAITFARENEIQSICIRYHAPCVEGWANATWKINSAYSRNFHDTVKAARESGMDIVFEKVERKS